MSDITEKDREEAKAWLDRKVIHPENTTERLANFIARTRAEAVREERERFGGGCGDDKGGARKRTRMGS